MHEAEIFVHGAVQLGLLEIDDMGRVWRVARQQTSAWGHGTRIIACPRRRAEIEAEYLRVKFMRNGVRADAVAHRLVWYHLYGRIPVEKTINHKNGNKHDNRPSNLELATPAEQTRHAISVLGFRPRLTKRMIMRGENNPASRLRAADVTAIRASTATGAALAAQYAVSKATISRVRNSVLWAHIEEVR